MSCERILVVDDEPQILRFLRPSLTAAGYDVITAATGAEALKLGGGQGARCCPARSRPARHRRQGGDRELRAWSQVPIIVVSARDREAEKIAALDLGADDYIDKPFGIGELLARLARGAAARGPPCRRENDVFSRRPRRRCAAHTVMRDGQPVKLTPKEFDLLAMLVRHAGRVVTHAQILTAVWGPAHAHDVQYLRVFIGQVRQKLARPADGHELIQTEPGIGYRLAEAQGQS